MEFNNLYELKDRLLPALKLKEEEFKNEKINISASDIWNFLCEKWIKSHELTLNEMVNDILKLKYSDMTR